MSLPKASIALLMLFSAATPQSRALQYVMSNSSTSSFSEMQGLSFVDFIYTDLFTSAIVNNSITISSVLPSDLTPCVIPVVESWKLVGTAIVAYKFILLLASQNQFARRKATSYVIVLVNPWSCEPKIVEIHNYDEVPAHDWPQDLGFLLPYEDSFDLFFASQRSCSPCRFDAEGQRIEMQYSLEPVPGGHDGYSLHAIEEGNQKSGYVYTYQIPAVWTFNGKNVDPDAKVRHKLDEEFQEVDQVILEQLI